MQLIALLVMDRFKIEYQIQQMMVNVIVLINIMIPEYKNAKAVSIRASNAKVKKQK